MVRPRHPLSIKAAKGTTTTLFLHSKACNCAVAFHPVASHNDLDSHFADLHMTLLPGGYSCGESPWEGHTDRARFLFAGRITYKVAGGAATNTRPLRTVHMM
eukprot:TRINITY_DN767_c0_g1_i3.p2 TRINITY_DN767_c0_g1~~TRINITY_DN767_c0_g1_i3.p2  ORF type:complete len:102 (-),score=6.62 TRINITY_DN767_c0_g1_i3:42-347(-)